MPKLPTTPGWVQTITGPNLRDEDGNDVGRMPNLKIVGGTVTSDPLNDQNILTVTGSGGGGQSVTGSVEYRPYHLPILAGVATVTFPSGSKQLLGSTTFDHSKVNTAIGAVKYSFGATMAPASVNGFCYVDLYDYGGIVRWPPGPIVSAVLTGSTQGQLTRSSVDLTAILSAVTGSGVLTARGWIDGAGNAATVCDVRLTLEWV